jgi:hypothetical protein
VVLVANDSLKLAMAHLVGEFYPVLWRHYIDQLQRSG